MICLRSGSALMIQWHDYIGPLVTPARESSDVPLPDCRSGYRRWFATNEADGGSRFRLVKSVQLNVEADPSWVIEKLGFVVSL
jgi:hypothetical protein